MCRAADEATDNAGRIQSAGSISRLNSHHLLPTRRSSPVGDTYLYIVALVIPSSSQRSPTTVPFFPIAAAASRTLAGVIFGLRPPLRPRARAAAKAARVL